MKSLFLLVLLLSSLLGCSCAHAPLPPAVMPVHPSVVRLYGELTDELANQVALQIFEAPSKEPLALVIDSPGGSIEGMWAVMEALHERSAPNICIVQGQALSAAAILFESKGCHVRVMRPSSQLMFHLPSLGLGITGNEQDFRNAVADLTSLKLGLVEVLQARVGAKVAALLQQQMESGQQLWFSSSVAKALGLADIVD